MRVADVVFERREDVLVAYIEGEVDMSNAGGLRTAVGEQVPNDAVAAVVVLEKVTYLDSAGIALIFELNERLRQRSQELRLVIPDSSPAADTLRLAGVREAVATWETLDEALPASE